MPGRSGASTDTGHRWPRAGLQFLYVFPFIDVAVGKGGDEEVVDGGDCRLDAAAVEPADHVLVAERIVFDVDLSYDSDDTGMQFCADGCGRGRYVRIVPSVVRVKYVAVPVAEDSLYGSGSDVYS